MVRITARAQFNLKHTVADDPFFTTRPRSKHKMAARQLTLRELHLATPTVPATFGWCRQNGLLAAAMECDTCAPVNGARSMMEQRPYTRSVDGVIWRCPRRDCRLMTFIQVH